MDKIQSPPILKVKFFWNTATPIHFPIACGRFCFAVVDLSPCDRGCLAHKPEIFTIQPWNELHEVKLLLKDANTIKALDIYCQLCYKSYTISTPLHYTLQHWFLLSFFLSFPPFLPSPLPIFLPSFFLPFLLSSFLPFLIYLINLWDLLLLFLPYNYFLKRSSILL